MLGSLLLRLTIGFALFAVLLEVFAAYSKLPDIRTTFLGLRTLWREGLLLHDLAVSTGRWLFGWAFGAPVGVLLGVLTGRVVAAAVALEGLFIILRAIPFICLVPLSILVFGLGEPGKFFLVAWASVSVCWVIAHQGAQSLPIHHRWRASSLAVPRLRWVARILFPELSPAIFAALRTSLSLALIVVAVAEMSGVYERSSGYWWSEGLGYRMFRSLDRARNDLLMGAIVAYATIGVVGDSVFGWLWKGASYLMELLQRTHVARGMASAADPAPNGVEIQPAATVAVQGLSAAYDGKIVIDRLNLTIAGGKTLVIVGPSGCGKTTLLRALAHLRGHGFTVSGSVVIDHRRSPDTPGTIGLVLQDAPVFGRLTVADNVAVGGWSRQLPRKIVMSRVRTLLKEFGIEGIAAEFADRISGGQRQRVALASAVASRPRVLLFDEPFGALDAMTRRRLQAFYCEHIHERFSAVFVTHDIEEALLVGHRIRIGVARDALEFPVDRPRGELRDWELSPEFMALRNRLIDALEATSTNQ